MDVSTVTEWCRDGVLPGAIRMPGANKRWRIPLADVEALERGQLATGSDDADTTD